MWTERNTKTAIITGGSSGIGFGVDKAHVERGGNVGEAKDIVAAVLYLADAESVTGVVLPVDGGVSAGG